MNHACMNAAVWIAEGNQWYRSAATGFLRRDK
jgi:hypothetical protein